MSTSIPDIMNITKYRVNNLEPIIKYIIAQNYNYFIFIQSPPDINGAYNVYQKSLIKKDDYLTKILSKGIYSHENINNIKDNNPDEYIINIFVDYYNNTDRGKNNKITVDNINSILLLKQ